MLHGDGSAGMLERDFSAERSSRALESDYWRRHLLWRFCNGSMEIFSAERSSGRWIITVIPLSRQLTLMVLFSAERLSRRWNRFTGEGAYFDGSVIGVSWDFSSGRVEQVLDCGSTLISWSAL